MRRLQLHIRGRVQGVFFRQSAQDEAQRLGLVGYVRNLPNGQVEAVAEGADESLDAFLDWCRRGPPHARVDNVEALSQIATGEFPDFSVRFGREA